MDLGIIDNYYFSTNKYPMTQFCSNLIIAMAVNHTQHGYFLPVLIKKQKNSSTSGEKKIIFAIFLVES